MPRASKVSVDKAVYKDLFDSFTNLLSDLNDNNQMTKFLNDFLTSEEKLMLSKRLMLALMIHEGYRISEIKEILKVSPTTVILMKHWLLYKKGISIGVEKLITKQRKEKFDRKERGLLKYIPPLSRSKKDMAKWLNR